MDSLAPLIAPNPTLPITVKDIIVTSIVLGLAGTVRLLLSEIVLKTLVVIGLKKLSRSTKNDVDDQLVAAVQGALEKEKNSL